MRPGVLGPQRSCGANSISITRFSCGGSIFPQHVRVAALVHCVGDARVVHFVETLHGLVALQQVGRGWGQRVGAVRVPDAEGDLDGLGVDEDVPLVSGMRQTLEVVGEKELSELGKYCASCRAVT